MEESKSGKLAPAFIHEKVITPDNKVRVYKCDTWGKFMAYVREVPYLEQKKDSQRYGTRAIFRGHSDPKWVLSSPLERNCLQPVEAFRDGVRVPINLKNSNGPGWYERQCENILERFKFNAHGDREIRAGATDAEIWAVGRHYGLLSPLLDWTVSPYIAAFFALETVYQRYQLFRPLDMFPKGETANVWGLQLFEELFIEKEFELVQTKPPFGSRLRAQCGLFTQLMDTNYWDVKSYLESRGIAHFLEVYELPAEIAMEALRDLSLMNIDVGTIFPGLSGAALAANVDEEAFRLAMITRNFEALDGNPSL